MTRGLTRDNVSSINGLIRNLGGGGGGANAQNLTWGRKAGSQVTLSNGDLTMEGTGANWWYACGGDVQDSEFAKTRASGGKWMFEVTIDSVPTTGSFCSIGFGQDTTSGFDTALAGNLNGCTVLIDDESGTLCRMYYGFSAGTQVTCDNPLFPLDGGGSVITMGIDLDAETYSAYMDGVAMHEDKTYALSGGEDTEVIFVVKSFSGTIMTLNTEVQYPIDGYTVWG